MPGKRKRRPGSSQPPTHSAAKRGKKDPNDATCTPTKELVSPLRSSTVPGQRQARPAPVGEPDGWRGRATEALRQLAAAAPSASDDEGVSEEEQCTTNEDGETLYVIESIVGTKRNSDRVECYIVRWEGYAEPSLELVSRVRSDSAFAPALCVLFVVPVAWCSSKHTSS